MPANLNRAREYGTARASALGGTTRKAELVVHVDAPIGAVVFVIATMTNQANAAPKEDAEVVGSFADLRVTKTHVFRGIRELAPRRRERPAVWIEDGGTSASA